MRIKRLSWRLFIVCIGVTFLSIVTITIYASHTYKVFYLKNLTEESLVKVRLIRSLLISRLNSSESGEEIDLLCKAIGSSINCRITVIHPSGAVLGDSQKDPNKMENHAHRPEIMRALRGENGVEERFSSTLGYSMLYIAIPVMQGGNVAAILRLSEPMLQIYKHTHMFYLQMGIASAIALMLIAIACLSIARKMSKPISEMKNGAERIAGGDLGFRLRIPDGEEVRGLALALNSMAKSLEDRILTITSQRNELDVILNGMSEGVLAIDAEEKIINMNPAAAALLDVSLENAKGIWIHDIVRNSSLQRFIQDTMDSDSMVEANFTLPGPAGECHIDAKGKKLGTSKSASDGAIMVLYDVTRLKRLEIMRKEFVANVSHELRTPLTAIKGFVETIIQGEYALDDDVRKFLEIVSTKTDRLCSIVDDLLTLSSIEREHEQKDIKFTPVKIKSVLEDAVRTCFTKAESGNIDLKIDCDEITEVTTNPDLLEQAISNLIDNAIKYSPAGKTVRIEAEEREDNLIISIIDEGIGIPVEHQQRIFERFYRVDKARSRKVGGTGLGLSIVKNICISLGAKVTVESKSGEGSTFRIVLGKRGKELLVKKTAD